MSFQAMTWAVKQALPVHQKMVLLMLANRVNSDTGRCDPSMDRLAFDCGMSKSSVKNAIRAMKDAGIIIAHERRVGTVNLPNQYELSMSENTGVGQEVTGGGAGGDPGVGQEVTPNQEDQSGIEPITSDDDLFGTSETSQQEHQPLKQDDLSDRFTEFWKVYPPGRKTDKPKARSAFFRIVQGKSKDIPKTSADTIISAAKRYAATDPDPKFVPLPTTWLNGARWDEFPEPETPATPTTWNDPNDWEERVR